MKSMVTGNRTTGTREFLIFLICAVVLLSLLFAKSFFPEYVHFSNDNPLGMMAADWLKLPEGFDGSWYDINWLGFSSGAAIIVPTNFLRMLLGSVLYAKFYPPLALLFLACCSWLFFRCLGCKPLVAGICALIVPLTSVYFSAATWGVGTQQFTLGYNALAMAAILNAQRNPRFYWIKIALAGLAVGMGVLEGGDIGGIYSVFTGLFALYLVLRQTQLPLAKRAVKGALMGIVLVVCALLIASQMLTVLFATQFKGTTVEQQQKESAEKGWSWATQWSLPKVETLQIIVPGLFGYRMDTTDGGNYWGSVGRDLSLDEYFAQGAKGTPPPGLMRFSGGGIYTGVGVCLIAIWALAQLLARRNSVFSQDDRKVLWFWLGAGVVSLLLAYGRFAPFYRLFYALPYVASIRNPAKFTNTFELALLVFFGYGLRGLVTRYLEVPAAAAAHPGVVDQFKAWWPKAGLFERRWIIGCIVTLGVSLLAWLVYASSQNDLVRYLQSAGFDENMAPLIAGFSIRQVGWFVLFFVVSAGLLALAMAGVFSGSRARAGLVLIALVLVTDLARANMPWIVHWDYKQKYATNPVIDKLRQAPWEGRAVIFPNYLLRVFQMPAELSGAQEYVAQLYGIEWAQHHFPYYNIQSLDVIQLPRAPMDYVNYEGTLQPKSSADIRTLVARRWELTNTRYIIAAAPFVSILNQHMDPDKQRFRIVQLFEIVPKPGITRPQKLEELTAVSSTNGNFALIEFTGTLPRAGLYQNWQVQTNVQATLAQLADPSFDPHKTVLLSEPAPVPPPATAGTNQPAITNAGSVKITSYAPKKIVLQARAPAPSILLLNDRYDADWKAFVDGKPEKIQRANYLMRAVFLSAGEHKVEFRFEPPVRILYVSAGAMLVGLLLCAFLLVKREG